MNNLQRPTGFPPHFLAKDGPIVDVRRRSHADRDGHDLSSTQDRAATMAPVAKDPSAISCVAGA